MTASNKIAIINEILAQMDSVWRNAYRYVSRENYEQLVQMSRQGKISRDFIRRNSPNQASEMPVDFPGHNTIPMTRELFTALYGDKYRAETKSDVNDFDLNFHMTGLDLIKYHAPHKFAGCTGTAKLFCHFARSHNLDCQVIETSASIRKSNGIVDGHQIIGVDIDGKMVAFDPAHKTFQPLKDETEIKIGNEIQSIESPNFPKYMITALFNRDEFETAVTKYSDLENDFLKQILKKNSFKSATKSIRRESMRDIMHQFQNQNE